MKHTFTITTFCLGSNLSLGTPPGKTNSSVVPTLYPFPDSRFPSPPSPARLELVPNPVSIEDDATDSRPKVVPRLRESGRPLAVIGGGSYSSDLLLFDLTMTAVAAGEVGLMVRGITR